MDMVRLKSLTVCLLFLTPLILSTYGSGEWEVIRQAEWEAHWSFDMFFTDPDFGWVACSDGLVAHTEDGGKTWDFRAVGPDKEAIVQGICFIDRLNGYAVGEWRGQAFIWRTTDGGRTWSIQYSMPNAVCMSVQFPDGKSGWVRFLNFQERDLLLHTEDGGKTWFPRKVPASRLRSMFFLSSDDGWVIGDEGWLYHSTDGFVSDISSWKFPFFINDVFFTDPKNGWIVGERGKVLHTTDGGKSWQVLDLGTTDYLSEVLFIGDTGWIVAEKYLMHTVDNGESWERLLLPVPFLKSLYFIDENRGWLIGGYGMVYRTEDGGRTWHPLTEVPSAPIRHIRLFKDGTAWALAEVNLLKSNDGGKMWNPISFSGENLFGMFFLDVNRGWLQSTKFLRFTNDGGKTWSVKSAMKEKPPTSIFFVNEEIGWKTTWDGYIYKTTDGGATWELQFIRANTPLTDLFFITPTKGWAIWYNGVAHTSDGIKWEVQADDLPGVRSLYFATPDEGWMVGDGGLILHTTDGGKSWTRSYWGLRNALYDVLFVNPKVGFVVGADGMILKTIDGGWTWEREPSGVDVDLYTIGYDGSGCILVGGDMGTVLRYEDTSLAERKPMIILKPDFGRVGDSIKVLGEGYPLNTTVDIYLGETHWGETSVNENGEFHLLLAVPELPPGVYLVNTADVKPGYETRFRLLPSEPIISLNPPKGEGGEKVSVSGMGFGSFETVTVQLGDVVYRETLTDGLGSFEFDFALPFLDKLGDVEVGAEGLMSGLKASATFRYLGPVKLPVEGVSGAPTIDDLDGDGKLELIVSDGNGTTYLFNDKLKVLPGWPKRGGALWSSVALGDLDGDGVKEVIVPGRNAFYENMLYVYHIDGIPLQGWPQKLDSTVYACSPAVGDVDGDGSLEIAIGTDSPSGTFYLFKSDGSLMQGFPVHLGSPIFSSPTLVDLDGDGDLEIICATDAGYVHVLHHDGSAVKGGWPRKTSGTIDYSTPSAADVDGDGRLDVAIGSNDKKVYIWDVHGSPLPGWPQMMDSHATSSPVIGDIDGDGENEVTCVSYDGTLYVWRSDGRLMPGFPISIGIGGKYCYTALGDVDGDGMLEIVCGSFFGQLHVLNHDGTYVPGYPKPKIDSCNSAAIADLNGDGEQDIAYGSLIFLSHEESEGGMAAPAMPSAGAIQWGTFQHDFARSGSFEAPAPTAGLSIAGSLWTNPIFPITLIGETSFRTIEISNHANSDVEINAEISGGEGVFTLKPPEGRQLPITLRPGETARLIVEFSPEKVRSYEADVKVYVNGVPEKAARIKATAVLAGDVSGNGIVTAYDAAMALRYVVHLISLTEPQKVAADMSRDGRVTPIDAAFILRKIVGLK